MKIRPTLICIAAVGTFGTAAAWQPPPVEEDPTWRTATCDAVGCTVGAGWAAPWCGGTSFPFYCKAEIPWAPALGDPDGPYTEHSKSVCPGGHPTITKCREVFVSTTWSEEGGCGECSIRVGESGGLAAKSIIP